MPRLHRLSRWLLGLLSAGLALILALINSATLNSQGAYPLYFPYIRTHPSPTPRPTPTPQRLPLGWLARVNYYRDTANLPPLSEQPNWSEGNRLHARYMVKNDVIEHDEDPQRPWLHWQPWLATRGWHDARPRSIVRFNQYDQVILAAMAGQGIALGRLPLVGDQLERQLLVTIEAPDSPGPTRRGYWLVLGEAAPREAVRVAAEWIVEEAGRG